jgi:hypothetical protein
MLRVKIHFKLNDSAKIIAVIPAKAGMTDGFIADSWL